MKVYQSESYRSFFESSIIEICGALRNSSLYVEGKADLSEKVLYTTTVNLRDHYHDVYGKGSPKPRPIYIPHSKLFEDFSLNGSLHNILASLLVGATVRNLSIANLFQIDKSILLPILYEIEKSLSLNGQWFIPSFFLNKVPVHYINRLSKIILEHGGMLAAKEDNAAYIVDWFEEVDSGQSDFEKLSRRIHKFNNIYVAHFQYSPDSFDSFYVNEDDADKPTANFELIKRTRNVCCRFILDCEEYNEWGNVCDYEIPPEECEDIASENVDNFSSRKTKQKKKGNQSISQLLSRLAKESVIFQSKPFQERVYSDIFPQLLCCVEPFSKDVVLDISSNNIDLLQGKDMKPDSQPFCGKRKFSTMEINGDSCNTADEKDLLSLPVDSVSNIERNYVDYVVKSFSSDASYIQLRNSIINLYIQSPSQYLSATECRRKISGDVGKIIRLHEFLDSFNFINYSVKYESRPSAVENYGATLKRKLLSDRLSSFSSFSTHEKPSLISNNFDNTVVWTEEMDRTLLRAVEQHKFDWNAVSTNLELSNHGPVNCMMRFLELSLDSIEEDKKELNYSEQTTCALKNSIIDDFRKIYNLLESVHLAASRIEKESSVQDDKLVKDFSNALEIPRIFGNAQDFHAKVFLQNLRSRSQGFLRDYVINRLECLEQKAYSFRNLESNLKIDKEIAENNIRQLSGKIIGNIMAAR